MDQQWKHQPDVWNKKKQSFEFEKTFQPEVFTRVMQTY